MSSLVRESKMVKDTGDRQQVTSSNGEVIDADASPSDKSEVEASPGPGPPDSREAELDWIAEHVNDSPELAGKWIVLYGARLVSRSLDLSTALDKAQKVGVNHPFVFRVPNGHGNPVSP